MFNRIFGPKRITKADVEAKKAIDEAHRISFAYWQAAQPKRSDPPYVGKFSVPFGESVRRVFEQQTGLDLFHSQYGYWCSIKTEEEYAAIAAWAKSQGTRIFIRDCLDISVALDLNFVDNHGGGYTVLGGLEHRAKEQPDEEAIQQLTATYFAAIQDLPGYREATAVAAVPPRPGKTYDLPSTIAARLSFISGIEDVTSRFAFKGNKDSIKQLAVGQKWEAWQAAGLNFEPKLPAGARVILIDDKYQSGLTIQYVASILYEAGAAEVYGMCAVKTLRDTDNQ